jgi:hypothetical protein
MYFVGLTPFYFCVNCVALTPLFVVEAPVAMSIFHERLLLCNCRKRTPGTWIEGGFLGLDWSSGGKLDDAIIGESL